MKNKAEKSIKIFDKWYKKEYGRYYGKADKLAKAGDYWGSLIKTFSEKDILDVGCGIGTLACSIGHLDGYVGIDINQDAIEFCKEHWPGDFYTIKYRNDYYTENGLANDVELYLPFKDENFNVAVLISVFTHMFMKDINIYLKELHRVLKPNGYILATFFVHGHWLKGNKWIPEIIKPLHPSYKEPGYVVDPNDPLLTIGFEKTDIINAFEKNNFNVIKFYKGDSIREGIKPVNTLTAKQACFLVQKK